MSDIAIKFENISKQYRLGLIGTGTISHDLNRWWHTIRGKEDPYLKIGEVNDRTTRANSDYVWAIRDISFDVKQGEVLGIIGKNGAGKSTLLKILSRVTSPTTGSIKAKGRIASLLEVGTGFHPEMTGRENIYMNGAIMGMTKAEITRKLDEIIDFAGVAKYIDTPVKRYSSGMTVRLGFAIAAHLEPEILVVDEVLAVGDAEFQKKAIGKMQDVSRGEGRTVLFVSHNMGAVKSLCQTGILLENGRITCSDYITPVIDRYLCSQLQTQADIESSANRIGTGDVIFSNFWIEAENKIVETLLTGENVTFVFIVKANRKVDNIDIGFSLHNIYGDPLTNIYNSYQNINFSFEEEGYYQIRFKMKDFFISINDILVRGLIKTKDMIMDWPSFDLGKVQIISGDFYKTGRVRTENYNVQFLIKGEWEKSRKE